MKIIHQEGYSREECLAFKTIIFSNTIQSMKAILTAMEKLQIPIDSEANRGNSETILALSSNGSNFTSEVGQIIGELWKDKGVMACFARSAEFQLNDSASYYFDAVERLSALNYVPNQQDVLRSRVRTTGIVETKFSFGGLNFRMMDVGGQRNERKKWIHCFQDVTAVIFVTSLSEYDQRLFEDETQNRMKESLLLFDEICNSRWFADTSIVLFLNKVDLFKQKIAAIDLSVCFPEYRGGKNYDAASSFVTDRFVELNRNKNKTIYPHLTCATDTKNIRVVFNAVKDIILQRNLQSSGFL